MTIHLMFILYIIVFKGLLKINGVVFLFRRTVMGKYYETDTTSIINIKLQSVKRRKRNALLITETELKLIAAAAIIGDNKTPKNGYNTPAATGTPNAL